MFIVYSTGCPQCKVLISKLKEKTIPYKIISDIDEIEKSMSLTIPESTILFDRKNGDMYSFLGIINSIKKSMDAK